MFSKKKEVPLYLDLTSEMIIFYLKLQIFMWNILTKCCVHRQTSKKFICFWKMLPITTLKFLTSKTKHSWKNLRL